MTVKNLMDALKNLPEDTRVYIGSHKSIKDDEGNVEDIVYQMNGYSTIMGKDNGIIVLHHDSFERTESEASEDLLERKNYVK